MAYRIIHLPPGLRAYVAGPFYNVNGRNRHFLGFNRLNSMHGSHGQNLTDLKLFFITPSLGCEGRGRDW
jgi:hypothetical protein